jgi:ubiquinone/menaquinone biosynthesis C-methylase UbiE
MNGHEKKDFDFSKQAGSYDSGAQGRIAQRFYHLLLHEIQCKAGDKVLDVGCGTGAFLKTLITNYAIKGYGTDIAEGMLTQARKSCPEIEFFLASCDRLPFSGQTFDALTACLAYHHFDNRDGFAREAARVIKPGGILYISDPRFPWLIRKNLNGGLRLHRVHGEFFTPAEIESHFAPHGFIKIGSKHRGCVQVVKLQRHAEEP